MLPRKVYTREFKEEAVELTYRSDKTVKEIAAKYGYTLPAFMQMEKKTSKRRQKRLLRSWKHSRQRQGS